MSDELVLPGELIAGDTWKFSVAHASYPAPTWSLAVFLQNAGAGYQADGVANGSSFDVTVTAAVSRGIVPGRYTATARFTKGSEVRSVPAGWVTVRAATGKSAADLRSYARRVLDAVQATLEGRASSDQLAVAINGRSISRIPLGELREWEKQLKLQVAQEEAAARGGLNPRRVRVRFGRA